MKRVSIKEIAKEAGFSIATVSMALREDTRISASTREHIQKIARALNYQPNYMARGLVGSSTHSIGILVSNMRDQFYVDMFSIQDAYLRQRGYSSLLVSTHFDPEMEMQAIDTLLSRGVDGLLVNTPLQSELVRNRLCELAKSRFPIAMHENIEVETIDAVDNEDPHAARLLMEHLINLGHQRIALITRYRYGWRFEGYRQTLEAHGIPFLPERVFDFDYSFNGVEDLRRQILSLKERPTAIFAHNDDLAGEMIVDLLEQGFQVPEEMSVVGINDGWYSARLLVPLTTLRLPLTAIGEAAAEMLIERIGQPELPPRRRTFKGEVVVRKSTAPPALSQLSRTARPNRESAPLPSGA